jgi:predicted dehydrogenase
MTHTHDLSRRDILIQGAAASVAPILLPTAAWSADRPPPSKRITLGFIGTGNQGLNDIRGFLGDARVQIVAVCDVNKESPGYWNGGVGGREPARRLIEQRYAEQKKAGTYKGCEAYTDFRDLIGRKDIDAIVVSTPDHWHAIPVIEACKAKKDVYCQKPLSLTIAEGRAMSDAVKKHGRVFQCGSQQRSDRNFRRACELVRNGRIGKVHTVRCGLPGGRPDFGKTGERKKPEPVPKDFDYEMWLGPAAKKPYAPARCHVNFRWIYDYSGGQVTDWGGHHPDCAQWGMGTEHTGPVEIVNAKGSFPADPLWDTATEFYFEAIYASGVKLIISSKERGGVTWEGSEGSVWANRGRHDASKKEILSSKIAESEVHLYKSDNHYRNFIDCVISRKETAAPVEVAHRSITICHLGNIAMRLGRKKLKWDPAKEQILDDAEASKMLSRPYRAPWKLG